MLCRQYDAATAERWGLVNQVVPAGRAARRGPPLGRRDPRPLAHRAALRQAVLQRRHRAHRGHRPARVQRPGPVRGERRGGRGRDGVRGEAPAGLRAPPRAGIGIDDALHRSPPSGNRIRPASTSPWQLAQSRFALPRLGAARRERLAFIALTAKHCSCARPTDAVKAGRPRSLADNDRTAASAPTSGPAPFHRIRDGERYRWQCSRCVGERVTRRHRFMRATLLDEAGGCCAACGYDRCTANLHFHHVDPTTKAFAVNMRYGRSLEAYREEAKKCVLLCANCHGEWSSACARRRPLARATRRSDV